MRIVAFIVFGLGIALAGGGAYFVSEFMEQQRAAPTVTEFVSVVAASERLAQGDPLEPAKLKYVQWPRKALPKGAYTSMTALFGDLGDRKRFVARSFEPGEPILEGKLSDSVRYGDVPPDMRLVSIPINSVTGVSGFASAGDRVDILLIRRNEDRLTSQVILGDVLVYAVDQRSDTEGTVPRTGRTATVMVKSADAQRLNLAQAVGNLSLTLRGDDDPGTSAGKRPFTEEDLDDFQRPDEKTRPFIWKRNGATREKVFLD